MLQFCSFSKIEHWCCTVNKLVIFGVGLIGGSLALALKQANYVKQIIGLGRSSASLNEALSLNIIDHAETDIATAMQGADVVLIATPVAQTGEILKKIRPFLDTHTIVTDAGSTKNDVLATAKHALGEKFGQFVGGHPIAGAEKSGATAALANLYVNKHVILTPTTETDSIALETARKLWQACGANVTTMQADEHDEIFAAVSHLPHLLAFALVDDLASRHNAEQLFSFAASGFRDFTRIAGSHPEMWRDISLANKNALLNEISAYQAELAKIKQLLENNDSAGLEAIFEKASFARNQWAKAKSQ